MFDGIQRFITLQELTKSFTTESTQKFRLAPSEYGLFFETLYPESNPVYKNIFIAIRQVCYIIAVSAA